MESAYKADETVWQGSDIAAGRCTAKDLGRRKPTTPEPVPEVPQDDGASPNGQTDEALTDGPVTPAVIASLVADGSAAALTYLRRILDDATVPPVLRIKAAQSLLTTLPKQVNVVNDVLVTSRSYDALMEAATRMLAARGERLPAGNVIDVTPEPEQTASPTTS